MGDELHEDELTAEDILTFGPVVEAQVWTVAWLEEKRAPIAVAAGRPKLGPVFNSEGVGKAVIIRPCVSRGRRVRGHSPVYTPTMLEGNASVFTGWPMYMDHVPPELAEVVAKRGRSVKELGGQILTPYFEQGFVQEYDETFGYQPGGVLAEVWANEFIRKLVGQNPNVLHTSISAWPTSGKVGPVPWNANMKGMIIEGIRRQPQGSVDYVPRGGAGGRLLLAEGEDPDATAWPEPKWTDEDRALVVSLAESAYASGAMGNENTNTQPDFAKMTPDALREWVQQHQPHLAPALSEAVTPPPATQAAGASSLTEADVRRIVTDAQASSLTPEQIAEQVEERVEELAGEREEQRALSGEAHRLIEAAEGIPTGWKTDLKARYSMLPSGPPATLLVESDQGGENGAERTALQVLQANVQADLDHARDRIAEATGKPRVKGEGAGSGTSTATGSQPRGKVDERSQTPYWRERFADMGIVESADKALTVHGVEKVEG